MKEDYINKEKCRVTLLVIIMSCTYLSIVSSENTNLKVHRSHINSFVNTTIINKQNSC